ncbi:hypothetical protein NHH88_10875 [Oxalobacteraceae bacterium OTU3CAMAD1]|nr:hypothetical protein NHH88_10875 [Oxalobacteraceae bacterium OTU3CAMAD1]
MDTSKRKPDLMGTSSAPTDGAKRILAHLEHGARLPASKPARAASWAIDGWTVGLGLLLLAMCGIAWIMHERSAPSGGFKTSYSSTRTSPRYARMDEKIQASTRLENANVDPGEVIVEPAELPAAIVNDPASQQAQSRNEIQAIAETTTAPRAMEPAAYTLPAAVAGTPTPGPATLAAHAPRVASVGATYQKPASTSAINKYNGATNTNTTAASAATPRTTAAPAAASRGKTAAPPANDTDVALLTALVAHAGKPAVVAPERSRDIVERREGDSTADLLARCKQLGLIEGMLCRSRICSGRWESDATCRAPAN